MSGFKKWFFIIRPFTLSASLSPVIVGLAAAYSEMGAIKWPTAIVTVFCALCLQVLSNLINDYCDYKKGNDSSEERLGPPRAISLGQVTPEAMVKAICIVLLFCLVSGGYLIHVGGWQILLIGLLALLFAWLYSATSHSLSHLGIADFFTISFYGFIASAGTTFIQTGGWSAASFLLGLGCGLIATAILTVNNIRDFEADRSHGKMTVVARFGTTFGAFYYVTCIVATAVVGGITLHNILFAAALLPFAAILISRFGKASGRGYNRILMLTGFFDLLYSLLVLLFLV